ncbi:MAG: L-rhamnose mutarotase [Sediminibacterium sp.]|nr:L-rhamnose mutarotase [Sediminibacterium sp.]
MLIKLRPEHLEAYLKLHADDHPGVRDLLQKYNLRNFNIFIQKIDNQWFEFGYYEYVGINFSADMTALANEPRNFYWLEICNPMQLPMDGATGWTIMKQIYYNG